MWQQEGRVNAHVLAVLSPVVVDHLEENTIIGYAGGNLPAAERDRVEAHIDHCSECRKALAIFVGRSSTPMAAEITTRNLFASDPEQVLAGLPKAGDRLADRFTIGRQLGRGGMGNVFQATDDDLGIQVALKVLRPEITVDEEHVRHLRREILAGRKIAHPNVCRVFDLGRAEKFHFITMELVQGETLAERIKAGALPATKVVAILRQLLSALEAAHAEGIVHRDLKPANVMIDHGGKVKVMDFGLARDLMGEHSLKGQVGTPAYWSPEQARGEAAGPPADVYAVGVIAYLLVTGETSTRKLRERLGKLSLPLRSWLQRALEDDPDDRFPDAKTALAALPDVRESRRARTFVIAGSVGVAALGGALWLTQVRHDHPSDRPPPTQPAAAPDAAVAVAVDAPVLDAPSAADASSIDAGRARQHPRDAGTPVGTPDARRVTRPDASLLYEP